MKTPTLQQHSLKKPALLTSVLFSLSMTFILFSSMPASSQAVFFKRYKDVLSVRHHKTGFQVDDFIPAIVGFRAKNGNLLTRHNSIWAQMIETTETVDGIQYKIWQIETGFNDPHVNEKWDLDVLFIRRGFTIEDGIFPASDGNVGIGTEAPNAKLHVKSEQENNGENAPFIIESVGGGEKMLMDGNAIDAAGVIGGLLLNHHVDRNVSIAGGGGKVGIGTLSPSEKLQVEGNLNVSGEGVEVKMKLTNTNKAGYTAFRFSSNRGGNGKAVIYRFNSDWTFDQNYPTFEPEALVMNAGGGSLNLETDKNFKIFTGSVSSERFRIDAQGNVGIGTQTPTDKLDVAGVVKADELKLNIGSFPDYVFADGYDLMPLDEVADYIRANKHLPGMPTETTVVKEGMNVGEINTLLVEKIEELTLYTITLNEELEKVKKALAASPTRQQEK